MKQVILIVILTVFHITAHSQNEDFVPNDSDKIIMKEGFNKLELRVFPNPTKIQKVTLEMPLDEISGIQLINIVGKEVINKKLEPGIHQYELNLQGVSQGVYLIQVKTAENKSIVKKLLISED